MTATQEMYDRVFGCGLSLKRAAVAEDGTVDAWGDAVASLLFTVINEWEKNPGRFPEKILVAAEKVAVAFEDIVIGAALGEFSE